jgi:Acetyltransferase (GNAT) family.
MLIRKLLFHERPLFVDHLKRLPAADRQFRFVHNHITDDLIERYVAGIAADDLLLGCFAEDRMAGAAHVAFAGGVAELGVSVDPDLRGRGVGEDLFRRASRWARNRRMDRLYTLCQADNRSMVALARKVGMTIHRESGTAEAFLALDPPDLLTVSDELSVGVNTAMQDWADLVRTCSGVLMPAFKG